MLVSLSNSHIRTISFPDCLSLFIFISSLIRICFSFIVSISFSPLSAMAVNPFRSMSNYQCNSIALTSFRNFNSSSNPQSCLVLGIGQLPRCSPRPYEPRPRSRILVVVPFGFLQSHRSGNKGSHSQEGIRSVRHLGCRS